jgi:hypothetical protein
MMKKTVIRRHSKRWDMSPEIRAAMNADDDSVALAGELKASKPIFESPAIGTPAGRPALAAPEPELFAEPATTPCATLRSLVKEAKLDEATVLKFITEIGLAEDAKSFEDVEGKNDTALGVVIEQWADFSQKIKEAAQ